MYQPQGHTPQQHRPNGINVSEKERIASLVGGTALTSFALLQRRGISIPALFMGLLLVARGLTGKSRVYKVMGRNTAVATNPKRVSVPHQQGFHISRSVTVDAPVEELYNFWHDPTNFPQVMDYIESVQLINLDRARWTLKLPAGMKTELDVEVYTDVPNEVISWRSMPDSPMQMAGAVRFRPAPGDRGTEVQLTVEFVPPGGPLGQAALKLFGDAPAQYVHQYLRNFKQIMETGEKPTTSGQTSGRESEVRQ